MVNTFEFLKTRPQGECKLALCTINKLLCIGLMRSLMVLVMLVFTCGCRAARTGAAQGITPQILQTVERGISQKRLEALFGVPARHQFEASRDETTTRCVSYSFSSFHLKYYFVFTNDALNKIILPPRFEHELSPAERGERAVWKSYVPEERMNVVLQAPDLNQQGILASIERRHRPEKFDNALPALIIVGVIAAPVALVRGTVENRKIKTLAEKFNPYRLTLGMTVEEVEQLFGAPVLSEKPDDVSETRYYGSPKLGTHNSLLWVCVVFKNEKAVRVLSDDFFNYRKVEQVVKDGK